MTLEGEAYVLPADGGDAIDFGNMIITNSDDYDVISMSPDNTVLKVAKFDDLVDVPGYYESKVTIKVSKNEGTTAREGSFTVKLTSYSGLPEVTKTVKFTQPAATSGGGETTTKELSFGFTSNPGGWPTANSTTPTNYTYTVGGNLRSLPAKRR